MAETKLVGNVAGLQDCCVLCNLHREQCNTLVYNEDKRNCHLIEVDISLVFLVLVDIDLKYSDGL